MKRWVFRLLMSSSAALALLLAGTLVRSYFNNDFLTLRRGAASCTLQSSHGRLVVTCFVVPDGYHVTAQDGCSWTSSPAQANDWPDPSPLSPLPTRASETFSNTNRVDSGWDFLYCRARRTSDIYGRGAYLDVPTGYVLLASLVIAWASYRKYRRAVATQRRKDGICPSCGYDLRATPDRCPECGTERNKGSAENKGAGANT